MVNELKTSLKNAKVIQSLLFDFFLPSIVWSWMDLKCRYRRSMIGPLWETLNIAILISGMSLVSSAIFKVPIFEILPFLSFGIIFWNVIANSLADGASCFTAHGNLIQNSTTNIFLYVGRVVSRIYINTAHHMVIFFPVVLIFNVPLNMNTLLIIPGIIILVVNSIWVVAFLGFICARYRDLEMVIKNITQLMFFVTPIFWKPLPLGLLAFLLLVGSRLPLCQQYHSLKI